MSNAIETLINTEENLRSCLRIDIEDARTSILLRFLAGFKTLTPAQISLVWFESLESIEDYHAVFVLCAQDAGICNLFCQEISSNQDPATEALDTFRGTVKIPVHWITTLGWLIKFTLYGMTCQTAQHKKQHIWYGTHGKPKELLTTQIDPCLLTNNIPTFAVAVHPSVRDLFREGIFVPYNVKHFCMHRCVMINLAVDEIMDMIDRDGYTVDTLEFLRAELLSDVKNSDALRRALSTRTDVPTGLL